MEKIARISGRRKSVEILSRNLAVMGFFFFFRSRLPFLFFVASDGYETRKATKKQGLFLSAKLPQSVGRRKMRTNLRK